MTRNPVWDNAIATAHWLDICAVREYVQYTDDCADCPYFGGTCTDGLMEEAAKGLALLYDPRQENYRDAQPVIQWLERCVCDNSCLAVCKECPYTYGCPSGLLRAAADLIRAACNKRGRAL